MHWSYTITLILAFSILIPAIIGLFRFAQIQDIYRPFIFLLWIGCATEVLSVYFAYRYRNNLAISTIYTLSESLLLLWFFTKLGVFKNRKRPVYILGSVFVIIWIIDNFSTGAFGSRFSFYFDTIYAVVIVLLSVKAINSVLFTEKKIIKNPTFLICTALVIFFTYQIIQRMFGLFGLKDSFEFRSSVQRILQLVNFFTNIIFALAVLAMRKKKPFAFEF